MNLQIEVNGAGILVSLMLSITLGAIIFDKTVFSTPPTHFWVRNSTLTLRLVV